MVLSTILIACAAKSTPVPVLTIPTIVKPTTTPRPTATLVPIPVQADLSGTCGTLGCIQTKLNDTETPIHVYEIKYINKQAIIYFIFPRPEQLKNETLEDYYLRQKTILYTVFDMMLQLVFSQSDVIALQLVWMDVTQVNLHERDDKANVITYNTVTVFPRTLYEVYVKNGRSYETMMEIFLVFNNQPIPGVLYRVDYNDGTCSGTCN